MKEFQHFKIDIEQKLSRKLLKKELEFLNWVHGRYLEEQIYEKAQKTL